MNRSANHELASIIIPCWNQLEFTRLCIPALVRHTRPPWELIVVDNGSTDGTAAYLSGVRDVAAMPVTVISNSKNIGFPAAINQGLKAAQGEYLVLLNNDAVVTDGWLSQLIALTEVKNGNHKEEQEVQEGTETARSHQDEMVLMAGKTGLNTKETKATKEKNGIGLAGPMSNYASPPQLVENVPYANMEEMQAFARRWRDERRGQWFTTGKLSGFCLLMKRAVYESIGGLDEQFGLGLWDDDDLAERARRAGFELAVAHDLFVHHFGSRTFQGNGIDAERLLRENSAKFAQKWGTPEVGQRVALRPWIKDGIGPQMTQMDADENTRNAGNSERIGRENEPVARPDAFHLRSSAKSADKKSFPSVSLTMIVRDEEKNLPACLGSVRGLFDEIVVVDTGSKDRTREIAAEFGARVFDFVWVDDFAAARNAALARATGDYAFWLDADDVVDPAQREALVELLAGLPLNDPSAYVVRCACDPGPNGDGGQTVVDHIRLFPVREDVRWSYAVHEQILPALRRAKVPVQWTDITVRHTGYTDPALRERKLKRDSRILEAELAPTPSGARPGDPFVLFNLGSIAVERQDWPTALSYLQRSLGGSDSSDSIVRKLFALIALCHQMLGDLPAALHSCAEGLRLDPDDAELHFRMAVLHRKTGHPAEAEACWRRILTLKRPHRFCSVDQGIYGHLTLRNLAVLAEERGDRDEALRLWRMVLDACPGDAEALVRGVA